MRRSLGSFNRNIMELCFRLLPVQIFLVIASGLSGIINGLIIGNMLSPSAMVAMGLTAPLTRLLDATGTIISIGSGILCGRYMGRGEAEKVNAVFSNAVIVLAMAGIVLSAGVFLSAPVLAPMFGAGAHSAENTAAYIRGTATGILPMLMIPTLMTFLQMCNKSGISLFSTILIAVCNAVFCLLNVQVLKGGVFSVALATSASRLAAMVFMFGYLYHKKNLVRFEPESRDPKMVVEILSLGSPASAAGILYSCRGLFINRFAAWISGSEAVNALAILGSCSSFFDCVNIGVCNAFSMLASVFIGERNPRSLKELIKISTAVGLFLCGVKLLIAYPFGGAIAKLFGAKGNVVGLTSSLLIFYAWSAPFNILAGILIGVHQNLERVKYCNLLYLVDCLLIPVLCCSLLGRVMGIRAVWIQYVLTEIITLFILYINASRRKKAPAVNLDDLLYLGKEMDSERRFSISVRGAEEVETVSREIQSFCEAQGIDHRRSLLAGLCMEEMAGNIVRHGFSRDQRRHTIDVFACVEHEEVLLRLRDDCIPFDPRTRLHMFNPEDPFRNIGIRMVSKIAREMNYQTTFGMNVLYIRL